MRAGPARAINGVAARNQINRFIISFSRDELDPDNPDGIMKAAALDCDPSLGDD